MNIGLCLTRVNAFYTTIDGGRLVILFHTRHVTPAVLSGGRHPANAMNDSLPPAPDYDELAQALEQAEIPTSAAEAHGIICGLLCAPEDKTPNWQTLIFGRHEQRLHSGGQELSRLLQALYQDTADRLQGEDFDFTPLLPVGNRAMGQQVESLAEWCQGCIFGLVAGGVRDILAWPGEAGEFIKDISKISDAEWDEGEDAESGEKALTEIVEYMRAGVQLVYEEFHPAQAGMQR